MRKRSQRLWLIGAAALLAAGAVALAATALKDTVAYFYTPSDLVEKGAAQPGKSARVGGLVQTGSVTHAADGTMTFKITDGPNATLVTFDGIPPDLFAEGQGIVAEGKFDDKGELIAKRVLAKHDENYMPKEVYDSIRKRSGEKGVEEYERENKKAPAT
jgi:cytochrome c-type biogenesis protein CcmE